MIELPVATLAGFPTIAPGPVQAIVFTMSVLLRSVRCEREISGDAGCRSSRQTGRLVLPFTRVGSVRRRGARVGVSWQVPITAASAGSGSERPESAVWVQRSSAIVAAARAAPSAVTGR